MSLKLSRVERLILVNQFKILQRLDPQEAKAYERWSEILENGYELEYGDIFRHVYEGTLSDEQSREVMDILDMHRALERAYDALEDKAGIEEYGVRFSGFDGNNETDQFGYLRHLRETGRWTEFKLRDDGNSHMPTLGRYRAMLAVWRTTRDKHELTKDDVSRISNAGLSSNA
jgi:uncharacterized protein YfbU (UPF0304 family)